MQKSRALISGLTAATDDDLRNDHLKLCFLWYDEILIEAIGRFDDRAFIRGLLGEQEQSKSIAHAMSDIIVSLDSRISDEITNDVTKQASRGYPRWGDHFENYDYPEPETPAEFAHNSLLNLIAVEKGVARFTNGYEIQLAEGRARIAVDAVALWASVNSEIPCMLQANSDERAAMEAARSFGALPETFDASLRLLEVSLPSLKKVPWSTIVDFRKDPAIESLRAKIAQSAKESGSDIEKARRNFSELETLATDSIIDDLTPRTKRVAVEAVLANIPGLPLNPFSLYFGARDIKHEYQRHQDFGWFYLLRNIKRSGILANLRSGA